MVLVTDSLALDPNALTDLVLDALDDLKAIDPVVIDVTALSSVMDFLVIASGTSTRHVKSLADNVITRAKTQSNRPLGIEGQAVGDWVLVDFGDVVVQVVMETFDRYFTYIFSLAGSGVAVSTITRAVFVGSSSFLLHYNQK